MGTDVWNLCRIRFLTLLGNNNTIMDACMSDEEWICHRLSLKLLFLAYKDSKMVNLEDFRYELTLLR